MRHLYGCTITLMEPTFFSSREISAFYQTEPLLGNFALAYAFGFCHAPYYNDGTIYYGEHLGELNARGLYVTPGTVIGAPRFTLQSFNSQPDSYMSAMGQGYLAAPPEGGYLSKKGSNWYAHRKGRAKGKKLPASNRPQYGRIRAMAIGTRLQAYVISQQPISLPSYIRLGKFMSKARVESRALAGGVQEKDVREVMIPALLNPADLPASIVLHRYDLINVPPTPLVQHALLSGRCYRLPDGKWLPVGMRFGIGKE